MDNRFLYKLCLFTTGLAFIVVILGAYTRLTDAGLGCPDWPGCYGKLLAPTNTQEVNSIKNLYPELDVDSQKAWTEMVHRYFAGTLGLLIFLISFFSIKNTLAQKDKKILLPITLSIVVIFQALLGMWTVTLKLYPIVVMAHLLGGLTTLSLLYLITLKNSEKVTSSAPADLTLKIIGGATLIVLAFQLFLGGWTSANFAALACKSFPSCDGNYFPAFDINQGFSLLKFYMSNVGRVTAHISHRIGALISTMFIILLIIQLSKKKYLNNFRNNKMIVSLLLIIQLGLGISNVIFSLPLAVAVLHNSFGALLLLSILHLNYKLYARIPSPL